MKKNMTALIVLCLTLLFSCRAQEAKKPLEGKWQAVVSQGNETEKYLPDGIEFFHDGTVTLSDFPNKKLPFKTELSKEEKNLIRKNYPELEGKNVLLILFDPTQKNWLENAAIYQFTVSGNELALRPAIIEKPIQFRKVTSRDRQ